MSKEFMEKEPDHKALDAGDIALLKSYGLGPYSKAVKQVHDDLTKITKNINELCGIKESDTGLSLPSQWDLVADKQMLGEEQPLLVARCTKIIQGGKYVVDLGEKVSPTDIEEGMRIGVDRKKFQI